MVFSLITPAFAVSTSVGQLTIFCMEGNHAFLSFKNTYSDPARIGGLSVNRGHEITIGTFNYNSHKGIWYNLDSHLYHHAGMANQFSGRVSLTTSVTQSDVDAINSYISSHDTWSQTNNCAYFAANVWNLVSSTALSASYPGNPTVLANSIRSVSGYQTNRSIPNSTPVGYVSNGLWYSSTYSLTPRAYSEISATPIYPVVETTLPAELGLCCSVESK